MVRHFLHQVKFIIQQRIMAYQEKKSIVNMVSAVVVPAIYFWYVFRNAPDAGLSTDELLKFWGRTMMIYMPVMIGSRIIIHIVFGISNAIITKEHVPGTDERDKIIELKSKNIGQYIFGLGLILAMASQAMSMSVDTLFLSIIIGGIVSELVENLLQLKFYSRGF